MELTLLWAALAGVAAAALALGRLSASPGWELGVGRPLEALVGAAAVGMLTGRLAAMLAGGVNPLTHPGDVLLVRGGVDPVAATIGAVAALAWSLRPQVLVRLDALAPAAVAGLAGWHAGCLWRGACLGDPSGLPWGWSHTPQGVARHPVELYAAVGLLLGAVLLAELWKRRPVSPGVVSALALVVAAGVRALTEPLRATIGGGRLGWYLAGVTLGAVAAWAATRRRLGVRSAAG